MLQKKKRLPTFSDTSFPLNLLFGLFIWSVEKYRQEGLDHAKQAAGDGVFRPGGPSPNSTLPPQCSILPFLACFPPILDRLPLVE